MQNIVTWPYILTAGHSDNPANGACAMDAVNWLAHGKHGDKPECACPIIGAYVMGGNDRMPELTRQKLLPYLHRIAGSKSKEHVAKRLRILQLGAVRIFAPFALDADGFHNEAESLRILDDDVDDKSVSLAVKLIFRSTAKLFPNLPIDAVRVVSLAASAMEKGTVRTASHAAMAASYAAMAASYARAWDDYFVVLDQALNAGPQGSPWSADVVTTGAGLYAAMSGV